MQTRRLVHTSAARRNKLLQADPPCFHSVALPGHECKPRGRKLLRHLKASSAALSSCTISQKPVEASSERFRGTRPASCKSLRMSTDWRCCCLATARGVGCSAPLLSLTAVEERSVLPLLELGISVTSFLGPRPCLVAVWNPSAGDGSTGAGLALNLTNLTLLTGELVEVSGFLLPNPLPEADIFRRWSLGSFLK